jgi:glycosyltransferase involved in cell wall biosynthesis
MKILYLDNNNMHRKNQHALDHYKKIEFIRICSPEQINHYDLSQFDAIYSPAIPFDISLYPNTKFIFGPHFSVFPDERMLLKIKSEKSILNLLSKWVGNIWKKYECCKNMNIQYIPFGVDTEKFKDVIPFQDRNKVFIYSKHRSLEDLKQIEKMLQMRSIEYKIFDYDCRYSEHLYLEYLQTSKYGVIVDAHESQGFAVQEALSCNVPLFVWSVTSMNQEYGTNYEDFPATTIPYWDTRCGEYFYKLEEMEKQFDLFLSKLETYQPREYILENLSMEVCEKKFIEHIINL